MKIHRNVEDWERAASIAIGVSLIALAARRRRPLGALTSLGVGLIGRGATGFCPVNAAIGRGRRRDDTRAALGGTRGVRLHEHIRIARPAAEVYRFWHEVENLPRFMRHVERVDDLGQGRTHWVLRGPGGVRLEWNAEMINDRPVSLISWRSVEGSDVASAGSVRFEPLSPNDADVTVTLQYSAPGGRAGAALAWLFGQAPASQLREDLRWLKYLLEADAGHVAPRVSA
jgi:uncharacterized membrane protein